MLVKDWMSKHVISLDENTSIMKALQVLKEHKIRRIPVTRNGKLVGIVTDRDIKEVTPSKIMALDVHEMYYLLSEMTLKDIMTKDPFTVSPEDTVEYAAALMLENKISGLPVVDEEGYVVGIITQTDISKLFVNITGIYYSPYQISLLINHHHELSELFDILKRFEVAVHSLLTWRLETAFPVEGGESVGAVPEQKRMVFLRIEDLAPTKKEALLEELNNKFKVLYAVKEDLSKLSRKEIKKVEKNLV